MPDRLLSTVEVHTAGGPFRIVTSGVPKLKGDTIVAKRQYLKDNYDDIRKALLLEPRGHADMYGGYLTETVSENADFGIIFAHNEGYSDHCGHGVIALATAAVQLGWVDKVAPVTKVRIDAPCGFIEAFVDWDGDHVNGVRFTNVPSFIWLKDASVNTTSFGEVKGDIAYGGAFYFYVDLDEESKFNVNPSNVEILKKLGFEVKTAANKKYKLSHPLIPEIDHIYGTIINGPPNTKGGSQANVCVFADRQIDRSPCGSGTAGRVAQLFLKNKVKQGEIISNESIIGSIFRAKVVEKTKLGDLDAAIPQVEGTAGILGYANWIIDEKDDIGKGFLVRD